MILFISCGRIWGNVHSCDVALKPQVRGHGDASKPAHDLRTRLVGDLGPVGCFTAWDGRYGVGTRRCGVMCPRSWTAGFEGDRALEGRPAGGPAQRLQEGRAEREGQDDGETARPRSQPSEVARQYASEAGQVRGERRVRVEGDARGQAAA